VAAPKLVPPVGSSLLALGLALPRPPRRQNGGRAAPAPSEHIDRLLGAIVGIEIEIDTLMGKFKLSQNQAPLDRQGAIAGLQDSGEAESIALAELMKHVIDP